MKITFFEVPKKEQPFFLQAFSDADVSFFEEKLNEKNVNLAEDSEIISVFVNSEVSKNIIDSFFNLKFIATRSTGYDHIDIGYCAEKGIKISNVPAYGSHTVAEFAFGLMLNLSRNILNASNYVKESSDFNYNSSMEGFDLQNKTLGIIGTGKIGKNVVKIAKSFEMNVVAYDLYPDLVFAKENNFKYESLLEVLSESDIVTLHTPYNKENHHLINKENISKMKKGIYLINTARGELIDTEALIWGLKERIIAGFGADVLEDERILKNEKTLSTLGSTTEKEKKNVLLNHELMKMPNVIITPHIAFYAREAVAEIFKTTLENIKGFISGNLKNLIK
ncbi:MAG: NAD(P)-dependent oxidoreductase [Patescibacteria group bacterium]